MIVMHASSATESCSVAPASFRPGAGPRAPSCAGSLRRSAPAVVRHIRQYDLVEYAAADDAAVRRQPALYFRGQASFTKFPSRLWQQYLCPDEGRTRDASLKVHI